VSTPPPAPAAAVDPEEALLAFLARTKPSTRFEVADFGLELPGWTFFEAYAQTGDEDAEVPHYYTVRADGQVVTGDSRQELWNVAHRLGVLRDSAALPADTLATVAVVLLGDAERIIDSNWLKDWRSDGRVHLLPPSLGRAAAATRLEFFTFPQPMQRKRYFRWTVDLSADGTVQVKRHALP